MDINDIDIDGIDTKGMDPNTVGAADGTSSPATLHMNSLSDSGGSLSPRDGEPEPLTAYAGENILWISQVYETITEASGDQPDNEGGPILPSTTAASHISPIPEAMTSCKQASLKRQGESIMDR